MSDQTPVFTFFDPQMHHHEVVVKRAGVVLSSETNRGMGNGASTIKVDCCLLKGHGVVALLAGFQTGKVLLAIFDIARGMGVDQFRSVDFFEGGKILFHHGVGPGGFGSADRLFGRCGEERGGK